MAEGNDGASRSEEATPRRLEEARKEGDVPKSVELTQVCALAGAFGAVAMGGGVMARGLAEQLLPFIAHPEQIQLHGAAGQAVTWQVMMAAGPALGRAGAATWSADGTLHVRARNAAWLGEMRRARPIISERLAQLLGPGVVRKIVID